MTEEVDMPNRIYDKDEANELREKVDKFAAAMKKKFIEKLAEGYSGWDNPEFTIDNISLEIVEHLGDELKGEKEAVDIGNFAMMLWMRE